MDYKNRMYYAYTIARESPDPSTQNSALLTLNPDDDTEISVSDVNRFPDCVQASEDRWKRPLKYRFVEHAERNVIFKAASLGIKTKDLTMISPWAACSDCARAIIQAGIKRLVRHQQALDRKPTFISEADRIKWEEEIKIADTMLQEAGVEIINYSGDIGCDFEVRHSGVNWKP